MHFKKTVAIAAAVIAMGASAIGPASATSYPQASNLRTLYLSGAPTQSDDAACTQQRTIVLAAGHYDWAQVFGTDEDYDIYLAGGTYHWQDCVFAEDGYYYQGSVLNDETDPSLPPADDPVTLHQKLYVAKPGATITFGSTLDYVGS